MIRNKEGLTAYLSKVKMTDETKLKDRDNKDQEGFKFQIQKT